MISLRVDQGRGQEHDKILIFWLENYTYTGLPKIQPNKHQNTDLHYRCEWNRYQDYSSSIGIRMQKLWNRPITN